jgi:hypothetical protein
LANLLHPRQFNLLVAEGCYQLKLSAQSTQVPLKSRDLAIAKVLSALKARHIRLVHLRVCRDIDLRLADGVPQCPQCEAHTALRPQASAEYAYGFGLDQRMPSGGRAHMRPPFS